MHVQRIARISPPHAQAAGARPRINQSAGLFLAAMLSGASGLIAELVWSRYLHLMFGTSAYAVATLLSCFMVGLALGSWHVGRVVDRARIGSRNLLIGIELALGAFVLASPLVYQAVSVLAATNSDRPWLEQVVRMGGSVIALLLPTYLMGATVPVYLRLLTPDVAVAGRNVGTYYAMNTLGAAGGAFATGFVLMGTIGLRNSLFVAAALNLLAAALVMVVRRRETDTNAAAQRSKGARDNGPANLQSASPLRRVSPALVLLGFGVTGFVGMGFEVAFARLLTFFFRDSVYDLTIVLTAFLCGAALGSAVAPLILRKLAAPPITALAVALALTGLCGLGALLILNRFPYWLNHLQTNTALVEAYGENFWATGTLIRFAYTFVLLLIPSALCGAAFPLAAGIIVNDLPALGRRVGLLAAVNALGAALGAVAGGFLLADLLGLRATIIVPAVFSVLVSAALLQRWTSRVMVLVIALLLAMAPVWDRLRMSSSFLDPNQPLEELLALRFYREDRHGITAVVELLPYQRKYLLTNRLYAQNNSDMMGLEDHRRLGHIPMLLHRDPQSVLAVGLGAGITLRGIGDLHPRRIDCVEIAPAVVTAASEHFGVENAGVLQRPNVHLIGRDGRGYLAGAAARYDVIVLDILHPMSSGSSTVFSREYYNLCRQRLAAGGLVCQWLPMHQLTMGQTRTIIASLRAVFPHVSLWYGMIGPSPVIGCIASIQPLSIDPVRLAERYQDAGLVQQLAEVNLGSVPLLLSHVIAEADASGAVMDTDDRPVIEFTAPRISMQSRRLGAENLLSISRLASGKLPLLEGAVNIPRLELYFQAKRTVIDAIAAGVAGDRSRQEQILRDALAENPENADLRNVWQSLAAQP